MLHDNTPFFSVSNMFSHDILAVLAVIVGHNPAIVTTSDQGFVGGIRVNQRATTACPNWPV